MDRSHTPEPTEIGAALDPVRAAIRVVADGDADRITVLMPRPERLLPAARRLGRAAGVSVELVEPDGVDSELAVAPIAAAGR